MSVGHLSSSEIERHDARRSERLNDYAILDTPRETQFDRLVFTAAQIFRVSIAAICLLDKERYWLKAQVGMGVDHLPRHISICEQVLLSDAIVLIEDASRDSRSANSPIVAGPPFIKFYAGAPLITADGIRLGSFCVADRLPKTLSSRQLWHLGQLARSVVVSLESRRASRLAGVPVGLEY